MFLHLEHMEKAINIQLFRTYFQLAKPGIVFGNAMTAAGGFFLAARGSIDVVTLFGALIGLCFIMGSGCVFNNYFDRALDKQMKRTQMRALVKGLVTVKQSIIYALILLALGILFLVSFTNPLALGIALVGFVMYVVVYTYLKYRTRHATLIGSIAGAVPPLVGYCAVKGSLDQAGLLIFTIMVLWQMPHFFAISIYRLKEYTKAKIPLLPVVKGVKATKIQMVIYAVAFCIAMAMLSVLGYTNRLYLIGTSFVALYWLFLCVQGFKCANDVKWARKVFGYSLVVVMTFSLMIPFCLS